MPVREREDGKESKVHLLAERSALREDAARLLDELGGSAGAVAVSLYHYVGIGVRGPSRGGDSPLARYLNAVVGADTRVNRVRVTKRWVALTTRRRWGATVWLRLPSPVREFTVLFGRVRANEAPGVAFTFDDNQF